MDPLYGWGLKATESLLGDSLLFTFLPTSKLRSVIIRQNIATKKHLFLYHLGDRLDLGKHKQQEIIATTTSIHFPRSVSNDLTKSNSVLTNPVGNDGE